MTLFYGLEADGDGIHSNNLGVHARIWGAGLLPIAKSMSPNRDPVAKELIVWMQIGKSSAFLGGKDAGEYSITPVVQASPDHVLVKWPDVRCGKRWVKDLGVGEEFRFAGCDRLNFLSIRLRLRVLGCAASNNIAQAHSRLALSGKKCGRSGVTSLFRSRTIRIPDADDSASFFFS